MAKTKKANWEKISLLLKGKGVSDIEIDTAIKDATTNKEKEQALSPLQKKYHVSLEKSSEKNPTLQEYFGKIVADLLIRRKEILNLKKVNINKFSKKSLEDLTADEQRQYLIYLQNQNSLSELDEIDNKLKAKGIYFTDMKNEFPSHPEKVVRKRIKETIKDHAEETAKEPEGKTIQFK